MQEKIKDLEQQRLLTEELRNASLENERMTASELRSYSDLKSELRNKYGIPIENVSLFAKAINGVGEYDYDVDKIIAEFSDFEFLKSQTQLYRRAIQALENKHASLTKDCNSLEEVVNSHNQTLSKYGELESMGFGLKELKVLYHTINEIRVANNLSVEEAPQKFYKDVEEQYDDKLGFELKLDKLRSEISAINRELNSSRAALLSEPLVGPALQRLFYRGVWEQDIIELSKLLERYHHSDRNIDRQSLIAELEKYGSIESTINHLDQKISKLNNEVTSREAKKKELNHENNKMLSKLTFSKQITYYLKGMIDSLRDETLMRHMTLVYVNYILNMQLQMISKLDDALLGEFAPILREAKLRGNNRYQYRNNDTNDDHDDDDVVSSSINELKVPVGRAIHLLINKLKYRSNSDDNSLIEVLDTARLALQKE